MDQQPWWLFEIWPEILHEMLATCRRIRHSPEMAGTNHELELVTGGPVIILVEPQLGENIGMVARAMANFGLSALRLVRPRDGWPNARAVAVASGADHVIDAALIFETLEEAIADLNHVLATTARRREMLKTVLAPDQAMPLVRRRLDLGNRVGILFGRERWGLENNEVALADEIITFPVNPAFASLNIAQAVLLVSYEWMRGCNGSGETNFREPEAAIADRESLMRLVHHMETALDDANYFYPPEKREKMLTTLRSIFINMQLKEPEVHVLRGMIAAIERRWIKRSTPDGD